VVKRTWSIAVALALIACAGCRAGAPGVRVSVGFLGAEVSVQIGGGDLAPHAEAVKLPAPTPPEPTEEPELAPSTDPET